jgi:hypothetical protein
MNMARHVKVEVTMAEAGVPHSVRKAFPRSDNTIALHGWVLRLPNQQNSRGEALGL